MEKKSVENNYYSIACDDLRCMQFMIDGGFYNQLSVNAQQVAEKMLKSVMEVTVPLDNHTEKIMHGHNLRLIYDQIREHLPDFKLNRYELSALKDYYYDSKYPGDNFVNVTLEECNDNLRIAYDVVEEVNRFRLEHGLAIEPFDRKMCGLEELEKIEEPEFDSI